MNSFIRMKAFTTSSEDNGLRSLALTLLFIKAIHSQFQQITPYILKTEAAVIQLCPWVDRWALHAPASKSRFPDCVRLYLKAKFDLGERIGEKGDSQQVALYMRNARNENGDRLFQRSQWLTKNQVKNIFSRLAAARRKNIATNDSEDDLVSLSEFDDVSGNHWMEEVESWEEEQERCSLLEAVERQIGVTHPIIYDTYDLCEFNKQNRPNVFKVVMLKEICSTFDIAFKSRDTKRMLIAKQGNA